MILYHFTAARFVSSIRLHGIIRGFVLLGEAPIRFDTDYRWLTTNPDFNQEWAAGTGCLPYKRNEVRLTVDVPSWAESRVLRWDVSGPIITPLYRFLSGYGDPENWRLFRGDVKPQWIVDEHYAPSRASSASLPQPSPARPAETGGR